MRGPPSRHGVLPHRIRLTVGLGNTLRNQMWVGLVSPARVFVPPANVFLNQLTLLLFLKLTSDVYWKQSTQPCHQFTHRETVAAHECPSGRSMSSRRALQFAADCARADRETLEVLAGEHATVRRATVLRASTRLS